VDAAFDIAKVTAPFFIPHVGDQVLVNAVPEPVPLTIVRVTQSPHRPWEGFRPGFLIILESRPDQLLLEANYEIRFGEKWALLHMAPVQSPPGRQLYQIIFN